MCKISIIVPVYNVENYIEDMLLSVQQQSFKNYEVILVNDGSTDKSQAIIDFFCAGDKRFKSIVKKNGGVASARNLGIKNANGEYIVFYDPDDYIPPNALKKMINIANKKNSDIVIGVMRERRTGELRYNASTIKLGKKSNIDRFDPELLWSFSVCNKLFRRKIITDNNIEFLKFKHAEDAVFLFECIFASSRIDGCKSCVYEYKFRDFWDTKSATQIMKLSYLQDIIGALDYLEELIININESNSLITVNKKIFLDEFYARYIDISLLVGYYRQFWMLEDGCIELIKRKLNEINEKISDEKWEKVCKKNIDINIEQFISNKNEAIEKAIVTFFVLPGMTGEEFKLAIDNIYNQSMPLFKIIADIQYKEILIAENLIKENIIFTKIEEIKRVETPFFMIIKKGILFSKNCIRIMASEMIKNEALDFITCPIKEITSKGIKNSINCSAYTVLQCLTSKPNKYNNMDGLTGNKLFRQSMFKNGVSFTDEFDYKNFKFKKIINSYMITKYDKSIHKDILKNKRKPIFLSIKLLQKQFEDRLIEHIKAKLTKEDIKRYIRR